MWGLDGSSNQVTPMYSQLGVPLIYWRLDQVWMWELNYKESWELKELMLLNCGAGEDSWDCRRSNQSILKEISPEYSLERLMLKLKLQYFGHLMWRTDLLEKTLMLGKIEGRRRRGRQRMRWLDGITDSMDHEFGWTLGVGDGQGGLGCCGPWGHKESDTTEQLNWTELIVHNILPGEG